MVVSPCATRTFPMKVALFSLSRTSSVIDVMRIGLSRFTEKPCSALGGADVGCAMTGSASGASAIITTAPKWAAARTVIVAGPCCRRSRSSPD